MTKRKKITSAILSAIMCVGMITALTANAADTAPEPVSSTEIATTFAQNAPIEEFERMYPEQYAQTLACREEYAATREGQIEAAFSEKNLTETTVEEISARLAELGVPTYDATEPRPIEELDDSLARAATNPIYSTTLPYDCNIGEIPNNYFNYTSFYFAPASNKISLRYNIKVLNGSGKLSFRVTLYRQNRYMAGSSSFEAVATDLLDMKGTAMNGAGPTFTDLDSSMYNYFLMFENANSGVGSVITGLVKISD